MQITAEMREVAVCHEGCGWCAYGGQPIGKQINALEAAAPDRGGHAGAALRPHEAADGGAERGVHRGAG